MTYKQKKITLSLSLDDIIGRVLTKYHSTDKNKSKPINKKMWYH